MTQAKKTNQNPAAPFSAANASFKTNGAAKTGELELALTPEQNGLGASFGARLEAGVEPGLGSGAAAGAPELTPGMSETCELTAGLEAGTAAGLAPSLTSSLEAGLPSNLKSAPAHEANLTPPSASAGAWKQQLLSLSGRILRKFIWMLIVFFGITAISFWVIHLAPGTPTDLQTTMNPFAGEEARLRLNALYGLDKPLAEQYISWVSRMVQLDFGNSMSSDSRPVWDKIKERLPLTLGMNIASLILTLIIAVPIGIVSACRQGGLFDRVSTIFVFIGFAMPGFWLALLLMMLFAIELDWLPVSGITSFDFESLSLWGKFCDLAQHLAMPLFVYTFGSLAAMSRFMRSSMLEVLRQDYITTAKAKGLPGRKVIGKHALRNALLPLITLLGLSIPGLIGGSVIIESIFALPGLGQLFYGAVLARDYPLIMGNLVLGAMLTLAGNMLADLAYGMADPRIRRGAKI